MRVLARLIVIAALAAPLSRWMVSDEAAKMERYRSLSHDALIAVLQEQHPASVKLAYFTFFALLGGAFLLINYGGLAIERLLTYLGLSRRP